MKTIRTSVCVGLLGAMLFTVGCDRATPVVVENRVETAAPPISSTPNPSFPSLNGEYAVDVVCDTNAQLRIKKVTITDTKTVIGLTFKSETIGNDAPTNKMMIAAPGQQAAFYIADPDGRMEYKLLNVEGISLNPKWTFLEEGQPVNFTLTFERIPDHLTKFHLIEGKTQLLDENNNQTRTWSFMNVKIKE